MADLKTLFHQYRNILAKIISELSIIEQKKCYMEQAYSSLYEYLVQGYHLSEAEAYGLALATKITIQTPALLKEIEKGHHDLASIKKIGRIVLDKEALVDATEIINKTANLSAAEIDQYFYAAGIKEPSERAQQRLVLRLNYRLKEDFEKIKTLLSHRYPNGISGEDVAKESWEFYLEKKDPTRKKPASKTSSKTGRYIGQSLKKAIWERANSRCEFISPEGQLCQSQWQLQIDHIVPFSRGGLNELHNLRLLCAKHNRWEAQKVFRH